MSTPMYGKIHAADFVPISDSHPVEWLRGRKTIGVAIEGLGGVTIGADVVVVSRDEYDRLCGVHPLHFDGEVTA